MRHRTGNPNQEKDKWNPKMVVKGTSQDDSATQRARSQKKDNGCIKVGLKRRRGGEMIYVP